MSKRSLLAAFLCVLSLAACNTVQGFGQDVQEAGVFIEKAAK
jgi:predicted small secreted protein